MIQTGGISLDVSTTRDFLTEEELLAYSTRVEKAAAELAGRTSPGADFLGWLDLPERITEEEFLAIEASAARARDDCDVCVVIGIGGSYLGARAVRDALAGSTEGENPEILFAGTGLVRNG